MTIIMNLDINKIKKVYLAGLGGIGLSALAYYFLNLNKKVTGSDLVVSEVTRRLVKKGVTINFKQVANNINADIDLLIYSSALPLDHPEIKQAQKLNIPTLSYFQFLGWLSQQYRTIAVAGTNGKTTTTAMLGLILAEAGLDPTVIVGSLVPQWGTNFRFGQSDILVVEACEWQAHMLEINPQMIILTNIAEDHLDFYKDLADIKNHFQQFVDKLPTDGLLIKNIDDENSRTIKYKGQIINYGTDKQAEFCWADLKITIGQQKFTVDGKGFTLRVPGQYNIYNATAAIAASYYLGADKGAVQSALADFQGTWRRFEIVGEWQSNIVISDYAHHPDSIKGLLRATKDFYPDKKLVAIFQPHHHNRTKTLLDDFAQAFDLADEVIISEIYKVSGREDKQQEKVTSHDLLAKMPHDHKHYAADLPEIKNILEQLKLQNSVLLFIGAGDIDNLARELTS
jgi:UDP-N-acetylmuramate--alanine ligase